MSYDTAAPAIALVPPTSVTAYAMNGAATVTWPPVAGAYSYTVLAVGPGTFNETTNTSVIVPGLQNGASYTFQVFANSSALFKGTQATTSNAVTPSVQPVTLAGRNLLLCWLDANQLTGQSNGVQLTGSTWPDVSGNANNFIGGSGYSIPSSATCGTYNSSWTNSKPGVNFAQGTPNGLNCANLTGTYIGGAVSVFVACASNNTDPGGGQQTIWSNGLNAGTNMLGITVDMTISGNYRGPYDYNAQNLLVIAQAGTTNVAEVFSCLAPWLKGLYKNGVQTATAGMSAQMGPVSTPFSLGCRPGQANYNFGGVIGELLIYKGVVSIADHNTILAYLGTKYNISMTTVTA